MAATTLAIYCLAAFKAVTMLYKELSPPLAHRGKANKFLIATVCYAIRDVLLSPNIEAVEQGIP